MWSVGVVEWEAVNVGGPVEQWGENIIQIQIKCTRKVALSNFQDDRNSITFQRRF